MNTQFVKLLGLVGAMFAGGAAIYAGDVVTGSGIISAALSSAGVLKTS